MLSSISLSTAVVVVVASLLAGVVVEAQDTSNLTIPAAVGLPQKGEIFLRPSGKFLMADSA